MNDGLREAFRHNAWANDRLIEACRALSAAQLGAPASAAYGSIIDTFNHIIIAEGRYLWRLTGNAPAWVIERATSGDLDVLAAYAAETARAWEQFLAAPVDAERVLILDDGAYEVHAGVLVAQALHHGNAHREQICAILTGFGVEAPGIQAWEYADATGRARQVNRG